MAKNSTLEFKLHRLAYMQVIRLLYGTVFCCRNNAKDCFWLYRQFEICVSSLSHPPSMKATYLMFQILSQGINAQTDALKYARTHFAKFVNIFQKEIQILMGALMYLPVGIENSPYRTLIAPEMWIEVFA